MDEITPATGEDWRELEIQASTPEGHTARAVLELLQRLVRVEPVEPAPQAPQGVTVEELGQVLSCPPGSHGSSLIRANWLMSHPKIGPLLRGEGAPVPSPVVLPEEVPDIPWLFEHDFRYMQGRRDAWAAARAEVARQQGGQDHE